MAHVSVVSSTRVAGTTFAGLGAFPTPPMRHLMVLANSSRNPPPWMEICQNGNHGLSCRLTTGGGPGGGGTSVPRGERARAEERLDGIVPAVVGDVAAV